MGVRIEAVERFFGSRGQDHLGISREDYLSTVPPIDPDEDPVSGYLPQTRRHLNTLAAGVNKAEEGLSSKPTTGEVTGVDASKRVSPGRQIINDTNGLTAAETLALL